MNMLQWSGKGMEFQAIVSSYPHILKGREKKVLLVDHKSRYPIVIQYCDDNSCYSKSLKADRNGKSLVISNA